MKVSRALRSFVSSSRVSHFSEGVQTLAPRLSLEDVISKKLTQPRVFVEINSLCTSDNPLAAFHLLHATPDLDVHEAKDAVLSILRTCRRLGNVSVFVNVVNKRFNEPERSHIVDEALRFLADSRRDPVFNALYNNAVEQRDHCLLVQMSGVCARQRWFDKALQAITAACRMHTPSPGDFTPLLEHCSDLTRVNTVFDIMRHYHVMSLHAYHTVAKQWYAQGQARLLQALYSQLTTSEPELRPCRELQSLVLNASLEVLVRRGMLQSVYKLVKQMREAGLSFQRRSMQLYQRALAEQMPLRACLPIFQYLKDCNVPVSIPYKTFVKRELRDVRMTPLRRWHYLSSELRARSMRSPAFMLEYARESSGLAGDRPAQLVRVFYSLESDDFDAVDGSTAYALGAKVLGALLLPLVKRGEIQTCQLLLSTFPKYVTPLSRVLLKACGYNGAITAAKSFSVGFGDSFMFGCRDARRWEEAIEYLNWARKLPEMRTAVLHSMFCVALECLRSQPVTVEVLAVARQLLQDWEDSEGCTPNSTAYNTLSRMCRALSRTDEAIAYASKAIACDMVTGQAMTPKAWADLERREKMELWMLQRCSGGESVSAVDAAVLLSVLPPEGENVDATSIIQAYQQMRAAGVHASEDLCHAVLAAAAHQLSSSSMRSPQAPPRSPYFFAVCDLLLALIADLPSPPSSELFVHAIAYFSSSPSLLRTLVGAFTSAGTVLTPASFESLVASLLDAPDVESMWTVFTIVGGRLASLPQSPLFYLRILERLFVEEVPHLDRMLEVVNTMQRASVRLASPHFLTLVHACGNAHDNKPRVVRAVMALLERCKGQHDVSLHTVATALLSSGSVGDDVSETVEALCSQIQASEEPSAILVLLKAASTNIRLDYARALLHRAEARNVDTTHLKPIVDELAASLQQATG